MLKRVSDAARFAAVQRRLLQAPQAPRARSRQAGVADPASAAPVTFRPHRVAAAMAMAVSLAAPAAHAQGAALDLGRYRGKVVYLDFWASWCGPCKLSFPYMNRLAAAHARDDFVIVAVDLDRSRESADRFLAQVRNSLPVVYDPGAELARKYAVKAMPTSLLIGRDGKVRYVHDGFFPGRIPAYEAQIAELLHERP